MHLLKFYLLLSLHLLNFYLVHSLHLLNCYLVLSLHLLQLLTQLQCQKSTHELSLPQCQACLRVPSPRLGNRNAVLSSACLSAKARKQKCTPELSLSECKDSDRNV